MNRLEEIIAEEIAGAGSITFARFMELALYHPEHGYYTSGRTRIGKEGDYYTSPCVHPAFGQTVARFITEAAHLCGRDNFSVVEAGAGRGHLAADILDSIRSADPALYSRLTYYIVEKSRPLEREAGESLARHGERVRLLDSLTDIENLSISGVVLSNELMDALPFHRARFENGELREIYAALEDGKLTEITVEPSAPEILSYFDDSLPGFEEGQEVEINLLAGGLLKEMAEKLKRGFVLTIDYGYLAPELFSPERIKGTYKCIHRHRINEDPYANIGEQDITAHVDFSGLIRQGESAGLRTVKYTTQGQFLIDWGILDILEGIIGVPGDFAKIPDGAHTAIKSLFLPGSMGDSFKVLLQEKNMGDKLIDFYPESPFKISFHIL